MTRKPISKSVRFDILTRDGFRCRYCGVGPALTELHIDHVLPVALGGTNDVDNLVTACIACNLGKRTKLVSLGEATNVEGVDCPFADGWPNEIEDPVYFVNEEWAVTAYGLESLRHFYAIPSWRLDEEVVTSGGRRLSAWLAHMSAKTWVFRAAEHFRDAFLIALRAHHIAVGFDLQLSIENFEKHTFANLKHDAWRDGESEIF